MFGFVITDNKIKTEETNDETKKCVIFYHLDTETNKMPSHTTKIALKLLLLTVALSSINVVCLKRKLTEVA